MSHNQHSFTAAATATNVAALPVGAILDHFGPKKTTIGTRFLKSPGLNPTNASRRQLVPS